MQISSRFTLAVHIFACVDTFKDDYKVTSDFYRAVECEEDNKLFHFHENPNAACPVGRNIHHVLDEKLDRVQKAMERELQSITLEDVKEDLASYLE